MAEHAETTKVEEHCEQTPSKGVMCGAPTKTRDVEKEDKALFDEYRDIIEKKLQEQFQVPKDFKLEPAKVRTQVVAGVNYLFHVRLPNGEYAHVKVFKALKGHALEGRERSANVTVEKETTKD